MASAAPVRRASTQARHIETFERLKIYQFHSKDKIKQNIYPPKAMPKIVRECNIECRFFALVSIGIFSCSSVIIQMVLWLT